MTNAILSTFRWNLPSATLYFTIDYQLSLAWLLMISACTDPGLHLFSTSACSSVYNSGLNSDYASTKVIMLSLIISYRPSLPDFAGHLPAAQAGSANHLPMSTEHLPAAQPVSADHPLAIQPVFADVLPAAWSDSADISTCASWWQQLWGTRATLCTCTACSLYQGSWAAYVTGLYAKLGKGQ